MKPNSLQELYLNELRDLYDAEHQIIKALPEMIAGATSKDLKSTLNEHLEVTKEQVTRLEQIFDEMGEKPKAEKCKGMQGVIAEGGDLVDEIDDPDLRDAAIIASAQKVEHYEMSGYGTARTYANLLGEDEAARLLEETLEEEKEADQELTTIAGEINVKANEGQIEAKTSEASKRSGKGKRAA